MRQLKVRLLLTLTIVIPFIDANAQGFPLEEGPWYYDTYFPSSRIKVSVVARGINNPWGMAFIPDEGILIAERKGSIRVIVDGELTPTMVSGLPQVDNSGGLMDLVIHPNFADNRYLYFTYAKEGPSPNNDSYYSTTVLGRGRLSEDLSALTEVEELFVTEAWGSAPGGHGSRIIFNEDGTLFMSSPFRRDIGNPQNPMSHISKLLRLNDDGSAPSDNPFFNTEGYLPEIWSIGHRTIEGFARHPITGELWASEHGPQGGDEVNIIEAGANYGWPVVSYGVDYDGSRVGVRSMKGFMEPKIFWVPSIAPSGTMFYTGNKFPHWNNDLFVGSLMTGRIPGTGHIERIEFNANGEQRREWMLGDLKQRIRDVRQGPDGFIYVLTDSADGALLLMEPEE